MSSGVFVIKTDGSLVEMKQTDYDSEDVLQKLLATHPNLLAGNLIDEANPRKWLLISREYGIPDDEHAGNRWAIDHLFLDQDGIPTLVEVKRSSDTRIRREVVGQMLEYAANAVQYWDVNRIIASFESRCDMLEIDPSELWARELDIEEGSYEEYWDAVKTNMQVGKIRLLFVADVISSELRQIVEFLNEQMNSVEVLAIEIKQYLGEDQATLIPRVYGQSTKTALRKSIKEQRHWDEPSFLIELERVRGKEISGVAERILEWSKSYNHGFWYGKGRITGSCMPIYYCHGEEFWLFAMWTSGKIEYQFKFMLNKPIFNEKSQIQPIIDKLDAVDGISLPPDTITRMPKTDMGAFLNKATLDEFLKVWEDYMEEIKNLQ
jgi:hypothetical protein